MANQVKEQFESNSQRREDCRCQRTVVANQVKEQFESNSQLDSVTAGEPTGCGEPS